jgi:hypothetical protein
MFLLGVSFDLVVFLDQWTQIESILVVVFGSCGVGSNAAVVVLQTSHHDVHDSLLIFLRKTLGLCSGIGGPEFVGKRDPDVLEFGPSGFDFVPVNVSLSVEVLFSAIG